ncbi:hypothetical protein HID58_055435, partial [Brassica napus]
CVVFFNTAVPFFLYRFPLDLSTCPESMANKKFGPHLPTILDAKHIEAIYELWGRNSGFPDTMILAPRAGRSIIDGIPNRDDWCREKFFVFKINPASVGNFDFGRIPREWSDEIEPFGSAPMTPELPAYTLPPGENRATPIGLAAPVRPGKGRRNKRRGRRYPIILTSPLRLGQWNELRTPVRRPTLRSKSQAHSPGFMARPVSIAVPAGEGQRTSNVSGRPAASSNSPSSGLPPPLRASGEGTSRVDPSAHLPEASSWGFLYDNEAVRVTEQQRDIEIEGLKGKLSAAETERVAVQNDLDLMKEKHWREIKGRDVAARKERDFSHRSLAREYDAVLAVVKDKLQKKKKETAVETRLQEVRARIETLTEYIEGGFELEEELEHLRGHEISLDLDYGLASVSDPSLSRLELPDISGDWVDQE